MLKLVLTFFLSGIIFNMPCSGQVQDFKGALKWQITRDKVQVFSFTPDSKYILLIGRFNFNLLDLDSNSDLTGDIEIIETETGKLLSKLNVCGGKFGLSLNFPQSGISRSNRLAVSCKNGTAEIWDIAQAKRLRIVRANIIKEIDYYELSPDGQRLVVFGEANFQSSVKAELWDVESGELVKILIPKEGGNFATKAAFSDDGKKLAVSYDDYVYLWDATDGTPIRKLIDREIKGFPGASHKSVTYVMLFTPDGKKLITGSVDTLAKIWNTENGSLEHILAGHKSRIEMGEISDDGKMLATIDYDKGIKFWNIETGKLLQQLKAASYPYIESSFSLDNQCFFSPTEKGASIWDVKSGREIWSEKASRTALSPSQKWFLSFDKKEKKLKLFEFSN